MRKILILTLLFVATIINGFGQGASKLFNEVNEVIVRNIGAIYNKNQVKGYFAFYDYDKANKKNTVYKLNLMDEDLNDLGTTEIEGSKNLELRSSAFDGSNFCFKFWNVDTKSYEMKVYDQQGKEVITNFLKSKKSSTSADFMYIAIGDKELHTTDGNGFISYEPSGSSFNVSYIDGIKKKMWNIEYDPERNSKATIPMQFLGANKDMILTAVITLDKGLYSMSTHIYLVANNIADGKVMFNISTHFDDNHIMPISAFFEGDNIVITGLSYSSSKTFTNFPEGLAFIKVDKTGKVIDKKIGSFDETLNKFIPMDGHKTQDGYYLYTHDIVRTYNNTNLVIAEKIKGAGLSGLELENMAVIEFDNNAKIVNAKQLPKENYHLSGVSSLPFMNAYTVANQAKIRGNMEYLYFQKNDEKKEITFSYVEFSGLVDYAESARRLPKNFVQTRLKNGVYTTDKVPLKIDSYKKSEFFSIQPAKAGYVLQINYYKKEKQLSLELLKLNN